MKTEAIQFDVIIAGSDMAAYTAAILYARNGVRVALITPAAAANKEHWRTCILQPPARSILRQLGLDNQRDTPASSQIELRTHWGWVDDRLPDTPGSTLLNQTDLIRQLADLATATSDLTIIPALSVEEVLTRDGKVTGIGIQHADTRQPMKILARLTVAADGAQSRVAELVNLKTITYPQNRFHYHAFYRLTSVPKIRLWLLEPDMACMIPHSDGVTEVICAPTLDRLPAFRKDPDRNFARFIAALPDQPPIKLSERISNIIGPVTAASLARLESAPGLALIGNAKLTTDSLWGMDAGWALQSAAWLVSNTVHAVMATNEIEKGLREYRHQHHMATQGYQHYLSDLGSGRHFNRRESLLLSAATHDASLAAHIQAFIARTISHSDLFAPEALARAAWVNLTDRRRPASIPVTQS